MRFLLLLSLMSLTSCSSYIRTVGTRMISPETHGKLGSGALEARLQATKYDRLDFDNDEIDNAVDRDSTPYTLGGLGELGLFRRLDIFAMPSTVITPTLLGAKFQFIGNPRLEAKKGNFSASILLATGSKTTHNDDSDSLDDFFSGNIEKLSTKIKHNEVGLIAGYRWQDKLLHYVNVNYFRMDLNGNVTTDGGGLDNARFELHQDGMLYSTGLLYYFAKAHVKFDYTYFTSDWTHTQKQTVNSLNAALGFDW
ncbi:hypothetical protein ACJVC5_02890 [Peredibacter sp. HCB2-198]|uniref:hypothetical protein n=1 Tax=Peredibacter sp. HCB2-198 TaxID=3383025 RepID=UPI0038B51185